METSTTSFFTIGEVFTINDAAASAQADYCLRSPDGKTELTLRWQPLNATDEEIKTFDAARASMEQGLGGTFEQLEAYLARTGKS